MQLFHLKPSSACRETTPLHLPGDPPGKLFFHAFLLLLLPFVVFFITTADAADSPHLFMGTISAQADAGQVLMVDQNAFALLATDRTDTIILPVLGRDIVFFKKSFSQNNRTTTWIGMSADNNIQLLLTLGSNHFFGSVTTPDTVIHFQPGANPFEAIRSTRDSRFEVPLVDDAKIPPPASSPAPKPAPDLSATTDSGARIDMMILYTNGMAAAYPGSLIVTRIQYLIDQANLAFSNSRINTRFNLVHSAQVTYPDDSPGDMNEALDDLTNNNGVFAGLEAKRTTYGADQVTLLRRYVDEGCGLAWVLTTDRPEKAYAVVHDGQNKSGWYCSDLTYVHEVGHNLGAAHDRANAGVQGRFSYSYGYQDPATTFRTVMAYACLSGSGCPRISYFSNPNVSYNGKPTGIADPSPSSADNARTINQTRVGMAGYRRAVNTTPPGPTPGGPFITPTNFLLLRK